MLASVLLFVGLLLRTPSALVDSAFVRTHVLCGVLGRLGRVVVEKGWTMRMVWCTMWWCMVVLVYITTAYKNDNPTPTIVHPQYKKEHGHKNIYKNENTVKHYLPSSKLCWLFFGVAGAVWMVSRRWC